MKALTKTIETKLQGRQAWLYLLVCILAFGLFIPFLGFYWDDWPTIFYTYNQRVGQLATHFSYDRPFSVWGYWLIGRLGTAPLTWHLAALLVRWGCVVALAWALKPLWPKNSRTILFVGLLFAIYPGYYLQSSSVIFSSHLFAYLFFFISLGAMGRAAADPEYFWRYSAIGLAAAAVHISSWTTSNQNPTQAWIFPPAPLNFVAVITISKALTSITAMPKRYHSQTTPLMSL